MLAALPPVGSELQDATTAAPSTGVAATGTATARAVDAVSRNALVNVAASAPAAFV